jgi:hypothetical protein
MVGIGWVMAGDVFVFNANELTGGILIVGCIKD